ncbi:MAG: hypothetical protein AAB759_01950 [Patescibacteria group bacterium]
MKESFNKFPGREEGVTSDSYSAADKDEIHSRATKEMEANVAEPLWKKLEELGSPDWERKENLLSKEKSLLAELEQVRAQLFEFNSIQTEREDLRNKLTGGRDSGSGIGDMTLFKMKSDLDEKNREYSDEMAKHVESEE